MKIAPHALILAAFFLGGCADEPDPWLAYGSYAAAATPGGAAVIATHADDLGPECAVPPAPRFEVVEDGKLGTLTFSPTTKTVVDPEGPCDGVVAPATAVTYNAGAVAGIDIASYRELRAPAKPDLIRTAHVRVR